MDRVDKMVGDYTVINSIEVGNKEIVLCENKKAAKNERYMCCYIENVKIFERYTEVRVSDDFAKIAKLFGERIVAATEEIIKEIEKANEQVGTNAELTAFDCTPITWEDSIENKVVIINGDKLRPEFRHASHQLMLCTGGFGSHANARGRMCYCISLYDGRKISYNRSDILGVIEPENLPKWAKKGLKKAKEIHKKIV